MTAGEEEGKREIAGSTWKEKRSSWWNSLKSHTVPGMPGPAEGSKVQADGVGSVQAGNERALGPRDREEQAAGETAGGSTEEIIAITSPTELSPKRKHNCWGPGGQPNEGRYRHETRKEPWLARCVANCRAWLWLRLHALRFMVLGRVSNRKGRREGERKRWLLQLMRIKEKPVNRRRREITALSCFWGRLQR